MDHFQQRTLSRTLHRMRGPKLARQQQRGGLQVGNELYICRIRPAARFAALRHLKHGPTSILEFWSLKARGADVNGDLFSMFCTFPFVSFQRKVPRAIIGELQPADHMMRARAMR